MEGSLLLDDTGRNRCKRTTKIGKAHKMKDKKTSGYVNGQELALEMLRDFHEYFPGFTVNGILADALYGDAHFTDCASEVFGGVQVVWRHDSIARLHTLRWLIEVFFEDWKLHEGWFNRALQQGNEGSGRGVILSALCDHMLLLHPEQPARLEHKQPALTVGCLVEKLRMDALLDVIQTVVESESPNRLDERRAPQTVRNFLGLLVVCG